AIPPSRSAPASWAARRAAPGGAARSGAEGRAGLGAAMGPRCWTGGAGATPIVPVAPSGRLDGRRAPGVVRYASPMLFPRRPLSSPVPALDPMWEFWLDKPLRILLVLLGASVLAAVVRLLIRRVTGGI